MLESRSTLLLVIGSILAIEVLTAAFIISALPAWNDRAAFGDMFGAVNSLFSGLALAGVVYAILLQRQELSLQRQELELTRGELQRSADAQEHSAKILTRQLETAEEYEKRRVEIDRRAALPIFKVEQCSTGGGRIDFVLSNHGAPIADLEVRNNRHADVRIQEPDLIPTTGHLTLPTTYSGSPPPEFSFELAFTDIRGERRVVVVTFRATDRRHIVAELADAA